MLLDEERRSAKTLNPKDQRFGHANAWECTLVDRQKSARNFVMAQSAIVRWSDPKVILVATNLLEGQTLILHAIYQARLSGATVLLVHVIRRAFLRSEVPKGAPSFLPGPVLQSVKSKLDEIAKEFLHEGILCEPIILAGHPAEQIALLAKSRSVDRVIAATRYASGVARLVEPSVAEELIATLDVPVCIIGRRVHPGPACGTPLGRVLMAHALDPMSSTLVGFASALAELNHSHLTLLHVMDTQGMSDYERELARMIARQKLSSLIPRNARLRYEPSLLIRDGDPGVIIVDEAGSLSQDVVILGANNSSNVSRLLTNGVVHRVVIESQCPVITIRSPSPHLDEEMNKESCVELMNA
jgi:nucleotide-binding universal stress UspA family protein